MCKSKDEPGGPYRCSGDMEARYERAAQRLDTAFEAHNQAGLATQEAEAKVAVYEHDDTAERLGKDEAASRREAAQRELSTARKAQEKARARHQEAARRCQVARADYDSTPRGVADLQAMVDSRGSDADSPEDEYEIEHAPQRLDAALERMNADAAERSSRWGSPRETHVRAPYLAPGERPTATVGSGVFPFGSGQQVRASMVRVPSSSGDGEGAYKVTFHNEFQRGDTDDPGKTVTEHVAVPVTYRPADGQPVSQHAVLSHMAERANAVRGCDTFSDYCDKRGVDRSDAVARAKAREAFDEGRQCEARGERIFRAGWERVTGSASVT